MHTSSRRRFLKWTAATVGAAVAAPAVVPSNVFGLSAPSNTVTMGMIGTGRQCYFKNIPLFQRQPDCRIIAVCDVDSWRMNEAKKKVDDYNKQKHGMTDGCATYVDYQDLLARDDIDAVMISTPDHWHVTMAVEAMEAGKDVALEKPILRTIAGGRRLQETSEKLGRIFRVDSEFRVGAPARRAYSIVQSGMLGNVTKIRVGVPESDVGCPPQPEMPVPEELDYKRWLGEGKTQAPPIPYTVNGVHPRHDLRGRPGWMRKLNFCDGMVTNWGTHLFNGALWCLGLDRSWPEEISGTGVYPPADSFWNVLLEFDITYKYPGGIEIAYFTESPYMYFEGDKGWIKAGFNFFEAGDEKFKTASFPLVDNPEPRYTSEKRDFLDAVKSRRPSWEPADVGNHVTSALVMGHLAVNLAETLRWDGEKQRFVGSEKANAMIDKPITEPNPDLQQKA
ncbi:MAG: gfo/Idh/MocA family oxidoreductase [Planctomycetota bacterium]|nr:MAG: gfo/Idh/MocA family oxidoreductase [Planctomycetota bacterium]